MMIDIIMYTYIRVTTVYHMKNRIYYSIFMYELLLGVTTPIKIIPHMIFKV